MRTVLFAPRHCFQSYVFGLPLIRFENTPLWVEQRHTPSTVGTYVRVVVARREEIYPVLGQQGVQQRGLVKPVVVVVGG